MCGYGSDAYFLHLELTGLLGDHGIIIHVIYSLAPLASTYPQCQHILIAALITINCENLVFDTLDDAVKVVKTAFPVPAPWAGG